MVKEKLAVLGEVPDEVYQGFVIRRDAVVSLKFTRTEKKALVLMAQSYGIAPSTLCYLIVKQKLNAFDDEKIPTSELDLF